MAANTAARLAALAAVAAGTFLVARHGGPSAVGVYVLLRVLPGLVGVLLTCGLPGAAPHFLAGASGDDRRLPATLLAIGLAGGTAASAIWLVLTPLLTRAFFHGLSAGFVAVAALVVFTQVAVSVAKGCSQGTGDLAGANRVIVYEEVAFIPLYVLMPACGVHGYAAVLTALILTDVWTAALGWMRLIRGGFLDRADRPSGGLAIRVCNFGMRGQVGGLLSLLNYRLDFGLLGGLAGAAALGTYAVASKYAELLRLVPMALAYVLYPKFAREGPEAAAREARRLLPRAGLWTAAAAIPLAIGAGVVLPAVYGPSFRSAVVPTYILLGGLAAEGVGGVITGFLYGAGRPGLNSLAVGAGLLVTVVLDVTLVPHHGAVGAAVASSVAYLCTDVVLVLSFWAVVRSQREARTLRAKGVAPIAPRADGAVA